MNNRIYKSDFNEELFEKQAGVTCMKGANIFGERQDLLIANGKQILKIFQDKFTAKKAYPYVPARAQTTATPKRSASPLGNGKLERSDENAEFELHEEEKAHIPQMQPPVNVFQNQQ